MSSPARFKTISIAAALAALVTATLLLWSTPVSSQDLDGYYVYVGTLDTHSATLAWGDPSRGGNSIGREATPDGEAEVHIDDRVLTTDQTWLTVDDLEPDTTYSYEVLLNGSTLGAGTLRTWAEQADHMAFLVMGDYGNGSSAQYRLAEKMTELVAERANGDNPIRFLATTGDNIYGRQFGLFNLSSGADDRDWESKFFRPYEDVLARIPFYASPGNHDGNQSEDTEDLVAYLDNFFFPGGGARRYYSFSYGGLADFFSLDTSENTFTRNEPPIAAEDGEQHQWLQEQLADSEAPWKIPYFHHPLFSAGPEHDGEMDRLGYLLPDFQQAGVEVVFGGHEHNYQASEVSDRTGGIRWMISGAGGQLRGSDVRRDMEQTGIESWAPVEHFLLVEIDDREMTITPIGFEPVEPVNSAGEPIGPIISVVLP